MSTILVLQGPNLNLLGKREPHLYGNITLDAIHQRLQEQGRQLGHQINCLQSNAEHILIESIQAAASDFIIVNPAGLTHTSIALRDALQAVQIPFIEVHLSNIYAREAFRKQSYFSDIAQGVISGLGAVGYALALQAAHDYLTKHFN